MSNHRWCCCGALPADCCEMQTDCATFVAPSAITIVYAGTITRTWSNGVTHVIATYTYTIQSVGAFSQSGNNCRGSIPRVYAAAQANVSYDYYEYIYRADTGSNWWYDPQPDECEGCTAEWQCENTVEFCLSKTYRSYGPARAIGAAAGANGAIEYRCCESCGCVRPSIRYRPASETLNTVNDRYVYTPGCCVSDAAFDIQGSWILNGFEVSGQCGCPSASTWLEAVSAPQFDGCDDPYNPPNVVSTSLQPLTTQSSCNAMDCFGLPAGQCNSGSVTWNWSCHPPEGGQVDCSATLGFVDVCTQTITITVV